MSIDQLVKTKKGGKKRVGRGYGSGRGGHTVGRGQKGQKSRSKVGLLFEGTKSKKSLLQRLPLKRGKGKHKSKNKPIGVNVKYLNLLNDNTKVDLDSLIKARIVDENARKYGVKILGEGKLGKKLIVQLPITKGAAQKIEKVGGVVKG